MRLERDGVFKSWAIPKGVPERQGVRRLAIRVADHTLAFGDFEGTIPEGEYGAGLSRFGIVETTNSTNGMMTESRSPSRANGCKERTT